MKDAGVKERSMLMSKAMAWAIRDGVKTQTRRMITPQPGPTFWDHGGYELVPCDDGLMRFRSMVDNEITPLSPAIACPYGVPGDRLVFLTGWATEKKHDGKKPSELPKSARIWTWFDGWKKPEWCGRLRMGRHLPGWARAKMPRAEVVSIGAERVESISEADAKAEGVRAVTKDEEQVWKFCVYDRNGDMSSVPWSEMPRSAHAAYLHLFYDINERAPRGSNPWVWVVEFRVVAGVGGGA